MLVKKLNILKKPYIPPRVLFEDIEEDERDFLLTDSQNDGTVEDPVEGEGQQGEGRNSMDLDFSMDFVINEEPQL